MHVNLIGPGRVGRQLAASLIKTGHYTLGGIYHPDMKKAHMLTEQLQAGIPYDKLQALPLADITLITTPDDVIASVCEKLLSDAQLKPESTIAHMSGILDADVLMPLKKNHNVSVGSLHPLKAFHASSTLLSDAFYDIDCAIEGDKSATACLEALAHALGARAFSINAEQKATYHAAACIASNYLVTLAAEAVALFKEVGIKEDKALQLCTRLMQTSLDNLKHVRAPKDALTGPLMRGDIKTIKQHLTHIVAPDTHALYQSLGLATLPLTELSYERAERIKACLKDVTPHKD